MAAECTCHPWEGEIRCVYWCCRYCCCRCCYGPNDAPHTRDSQAAAAAAADSDIALMTFLGPFSLLSPLCGCETRERGKRERSPRRGPALAKGNLDTQNPLSAYFQRKRKRTRRSQSLGLWVSGRY